MPAWLDTILNIILFLFCLSTLVMVHEAGHFTAAKMFGVYCDDFSIGFGKAFFHKKRKRGETYFSLRVIPFGGFVSMAGEDGELPSGKQVPITRSIKGIKKWKTAIIMAAGVIMNCVLSLVLFYVSNQFFPTVDVYVNALTINENTVASDSGLLTFDPETGEGNRVSIQNDNRKDFITNGNQIWYYAYESYNEVNPSNYATYNKDGVIKKVPVLGLIQQSKTNIANTSLDNVLEFYQYLNITPEADKISGEPMDFYANFAKKVDANTIDETYGVLESITFKMVTFSKQDGKYFCDYLHSNVNQENVKHDEEGDFYYVDIQISGEDKKAIVYKDYGLDTTNVSPMTLDVNTGVDGKKTLESTGINFYSTTTSLSYGEAVSKTFKDFGEGSIAIFRAIGSLFVGQGWNNVGSIVAIYTQSSSVLSTMGVEYFIHLWALISVNLAIFNLLPFPGLDGWQLLVLAIEGVTRKKVPDKAKAIASYVGLGLLMALMVVLIFKDIFTLF